MADHTAVSDHFSDISILVGADQYYEIVSDTVSHGSLSLHVIPSKLGGLLSGVLSDKSNNVDVNVDTVTVLKVGTDNLDIQLQRLWDMDSIGIYSSAESDHIVLDNFKQNLEFVDYKYIVRLPWKNLHSELPRNFLPAKRRLFSLVNSLKCKSNMLDAYNSLIQSQLSRGFIEQIDDPSQWVMGNVGNVTYLPHHGGIKDSLTTPMRIVYDCSFRSAPGKLNLNDCLYSGPALMNNLAVLLINFSLYEHACVADIEKAFLMVGHSKYDRDATRFLWLEDPSDINSKLLFYRFKLVLFGGTCSPLL